MMGGRGDTTRDDRGIRRLLRRGKRQFRIRENINHYGDADFREAERRFLIECVLKDRCGLWGGGAG